MSLALRSHTDTHSPPAHCTHEPPRGWLAKRGATSCGPRRGQRARGARRCEGGRCGAATHTHTSSEGEMGASSVDLDRWIEKVKRCEYLAEDELKALCEYVS